MTNDIIKICEKVLQRLKDMDYELKKPESEEKLIFPNKIESSGVKNVKRISEQELRQIFIEEFKKLDNELHYSIETPTVHKYSFGKSFADIKVSNIGQSGLIDMSIFEKDTSNYKRIYNIEFKHANCELKSIAKDIFKLIHEKEDGAFIILLDNTDPGTLSNNHKKKTYSKETNKLSVNMGVIDKLYKSFNKYKYNIKRSNNSILLVILSLKQGVMIWQNINKTNRRILQKRFYRKHRTQTIEQIKNIRWKIYSFDENNIIKNKRRNIPCRPIREGKRKWKCEI